MARVLVPELADWCVVYLTPEPGAAITPGGDGLRRARQGGGRPPRALPLPGRPRRSPPGLARVIRDRRGRARARRERGGHAGDGAGRGAPRADPRRSGSARGSWCRSRATTASSARSRSPPRARAGSSTRTTCGWPRRSAGGRGAALENARLYAERSQIATTLQESLLPPELPGDPGPRTPPRASGPPARWASSAGTSTTSSRPAAERWAVAVGDVCGKGPDAAAVTALARYTLRAAAMREDSPSRSLADAQRGAPAPALRPALLHGRLRPRRAARQAGRGSPWRAAATRCHSSCGPTGASSGSGPYGTLLGVVADPELVDTETELAPGDALVLLHRRRERGARRQAGASTRPPSRSWCGLRRARRGGDRGPDRGGRAGGPGRNAARRHRGRGVAGG